jgi:hypothetical protein
MPAKRARTSPESTYNTGHGAIKNLHEAFVPQIQPQEIPGAENPIKKICAGLLLGLTIFLENDRAILYIKR